METITTNEQLAQAFFKCVSRCASDWRTYLKIRKAIAESPLDLRTYFDKCGSLRKCKVPGVGRKTVDLLERILREGSDSVTISITIERENALQPKPGKALPRPGIADDVSSVGALHNAIRIVEQDRD
jgi:hypothetical protein